MFRAGDYVLYSNNALTMKDCTPDLLGHLIV